MVKILIWPVVLYGCETWTLLEEEIDRLQALEMWLWRGIEKISWRDRLSNQDVLIKVDEGRCLMRTSMAKKEELYSSRAQREQTIEGRVGGKNVGKEKEKQAKNKMIDDLMKKPKPKGRRREKENPLLPLFLAPFLLIQNGSERKRGKGQRI